MREILKHSLYFWIDHLEVYLDKKEINFIDELVTEIDEDNSCSAFIELSDINFHYIKIAPRWYDYGYKFHMSWKQYDNVQNKNRDIIIDAFSINFTREKNDLDNPRITLVIYSQLLTLYNRQKFDLITFLKQNFSFYKQTNFRRPDFCLDVWLPKKEILPFFKKFKSKLSLQSDGFYQTYYTRNIMSDTNRLMITRIYDKLSDTFRKKKWHLYTHLNHTQVNRIECEIRKEYAQTITYNIYDLLENIHIQWAVFIKFVNKDLIKTHRLSQCDINKIPFLESDKFAHQYYSRIETRDFDLSTNFQKLGFIPKRYMDHANWYAKNILAQTWYKGFIQYIFWNYFDDQSKIQLLPSWDKKIKFSRKPEDLFWEMIEYLKNTLHFSDVKVYKLLERHIKKPTLKLKR